MTEIDSYFVCATPRTGSSLLLGLLESTEVAGRPQAYFRRANEPEWAVRWGVPRTASGGFDYGDYVRAALAAGRTANGVFGAKLMWGTTEQVVAKLAVVHPDIADDDEALLTRAFGRTRYVYLRREDVVAQAVSWLRAEQTGVWVLGEIDGDGPGGPPGFDRDRIDAIVRMIHEHNAAWEAWFAEWGIRPHRMTYEELAADMAAAVHGVLGFLGLDLPEGRAIEPRHRRQADALNEEWVARYLAGGRPDAVSRPDRQGIPPSPRPDVRRKPWTPSPRS